MNKQELAKKTREALEEFNKLPPEEQIRRLIASGSINERGEVLMGDQKTSTKEPPRTETNGQEE